MPQRVIDEADYKSLVKRIKDLEKLLKLPSASMVARHVKGVMSSPTIVVPADQNTFFAVDGLNITVDLDSPIVMIDCTVTTTLTFSTGTLRWVIEVDGQIDELSAQPMVNATTARRMYTLLFAVMAGAGKHKYRLMVSSTVAGTITLSEQARTMRAVGLIFNRRRFFNGK